MSGEITVLSLLRPLRIRWDFFLLWLGLAHIPTLKDVTKLNE